MQRPAGRRTDAAREPQAAPERPATLAVPSAALVTALGAAAGDPALVGTRPIDRLARSHDASHFELVPSAVVTATDEAQVGRLFAAATGLGVPLTFRSGGTSLSGQGLTQGILVDSRRNFRRIEVLDDGLRVRVGPGATVRQVNQRLARHGRKLGPDPASESACTIGGVVANNSSGMACGTVANSYRTLESLVFVLPTGTVVDTAAPDADARLRAQEPALYDGIVRLRDRVRGNADSVRRITAQFAMKNTMGYGLNSFVDHTEPVDILTHLMVGSEGTLAFLGSAVFRTLPVLHQVRTGLLVFADLRDATAALPGLVATGVATAELLDARSLRVGQADPAADDRLRRIEVSRHAALLVEYQAATAEELQDQCAAAASTLADLPLALPFELTADPVVRAGLWQVRKNLYATVAGARPSGTTALLEDVVVPVPELLPTCESLGELFSRHGYEDSVIFGHAKDGNIHFMLTESLGGAVPLDRFVAFTDDLADLVLSHGGSLKAEHGTGRMMAPYVRRQYGDELYEVMWELKRLCDPHLVLNPGVVLSEDPQLHLRDLKHTPTVEAEVDRCVECGYCEPVCPSKDLTTTPRQRIVLRREAEKARAAGDLALLAALEEDYDYAAVQTCAVDGMCQTACPVQINTGDLVRRLRAETAPATARTVWATAARHWGVGSRGASLALTAAKAVPSMSYGASRAARAVTSPDAVPQWSRDLPRGGQPRPQQARAGADAVYFAACVNTMFGPQDGGPGVATSFASLCERAGITLTHPSDLRSLCCGTPWKSKGLTQGYLSMAARTLPSLWEASERGRLPVVCDASSCTEGLRHLLESELEAEGGNRYEGLRLVDAVEFAQTTLLPRLTVRRTKTDVVLHPTCSSARSGMNAALTAVAQAVADTVTVPDDWGCCGFAGDRGMLHPELTRSATEAEAAEVMAGSAEAYASSNRTCELGMTRATGRPYQHVLELLDWATAEG